MCQGPHFICVKRASPLSLPSLCLHFRMKLGLSHPVGQIASEWEDPRPRPLGHPAGTLGSLSAGPTERGWGDPNDQSLILLLSRSAWPPAVSQRLQPSFHAHLLRIHHQPARVPVQESGSGENTEIPPRGIYALSCSSLNASGGGRHRGEY